MADLGTAIQRIQEALDATPADHPDQADHLHNLGAGYHDRYQKTQSTADRETAIQRYQEALNQSSSPVGGAEHTSTLDTVNNLGILYANQGKMAEAEEMYIRALKGKEKAWGAEHTSTLDTVNNLAVLYAIQGKMVKAEEMYIRALEGYKKAYGAEHTSTLDTVNNLGVLYEDQGKMVEAEEMYIRALKGKEKAWGAEHTSTLNTVNNLGILYANQGKIVEAEEIYIRALEGYEKAWGAEHTSTLNTVNNLGVLYEDQGKIVEAEEMYIRALKGKEKMWGAEHISTLNTVNNLAVLYKDQGKMVEAEEMYIRALEGYEKVWGAEHISTLDTVNNLGLLYKDQGKIVEAEEMYIRALEGYEKTCGAEHTSTLNTVNNLGVLYEDQGKMVEAEEIYIRALKGKEKAWGAEHTSTLNTVNNLGILYANKGKMVEAEEMYIRALEGYEKAWGTEHTSTLNTVNNLGILYANKGKMVEAEEMYIRALEGYEKVWGAEHTSTLATVNNLGLLYADQGKMVEAEEMFIRALDRYEKVLGREHTSTLDTVNNLGILYQSQGKPAEAEKMYQRALGGKKKAWDPEEHPSMLSRMANLASTYRHQGRWKEAEELKVGVMETTVFSQDSQREASGSKDHTVRHWIPPSDKSTAAKDETGGDEDLDNFSDLSEASSVQSLPSLVSDSSASMLDKYSSGAVEHLAELLLGDTVLTSMYDAAIAKFGRERFLKNHDQLLKAFFKDLRSEVRNSIQLTTVRGLRNRDRRRKITLLIQNANEPLNSNKRQEMTMLRDQKANRKQLLDDYLRDRTSTVQSASIPPLGQDDGLLDEGVSSHSSDDSNDRPLDQDDKEKYSHLEPLGNFIIKGAAFARFKTRFGYLLRPPTDLSEALKSHDLRIVQRFLTRNVMSIATSDYAWLQELYEAGYSTREIAELLLEDIRDSPWIYFTPQVHVRYPIRAIFHVPGCAHQASSNIMTQPLLYSKQIRYRSPHLHSDVRRLVEELCGIGGVVPSSRDMSTWYGKVTFEEQSSVSAVTYAAGSAVTQQSRHDLLVRISNVLANFCTAAATVQSTELCCDSFTVLLRKRNHLELRRIDFRHALTMASNIKLVLEEKNTEAAMQHSVQAAEHILQELRTPIPEETPNVDLHYCALAAQFLCSAFLSYIQAHVGLINPFFLDKPQRKMILLGNQHVPGELAINAELVELTCLAEMTQELVVAFSLGTTNWGLRLESKTSRYDVITSAEDILDTWGPGYFIYNKADPNKIHAIAIGGGFVSLLDSKTSRFHWAKGKLPKSAPLATFEPYAVMRIGTAVSINKKCCIDEAVYRESSFCALEPLGTHEGFWETKEREAGLQSGQYLNGIYSQTWKKVPGTTLKQRTLQQCDWRLIYFLEQSWGLQVSFCTSVARRVSLRELVTDLLPIFVNPLEQDTWQKLVNNHNIMNAFTQGNLFEWLYNLLPDLQLYVLALVRTILEQLQHTGVDRRNTTLVIAWPQEGDIERGLRIPCSAETCWAQLIADAEDCATFAYVTSRCLETEHVKCRGNSRAWQNMSKMLVTEVSPSGPEGQPVLAANPAIATLSAAPVSTAATPLTQWELEDQKKYYVKKLDSLLWVKVERTSLAKNDVTHLVMVTSKIPQRLWKRLLLREEERKNSRIRERQAKGDRAELVVVRAGLTKP